MEDRKKLAERLQNMKKIYSKTEEILDHLPEGVPDSTKDKIKDAILGDKDLKQLMDGIENHRPPRFFLIGRTGVGKSSLINAICGAYTAGVSDTRSKTEQTEIHTISIGGETLMEICDTRGIAESERLNEAVTAEEMLINQINEFSPDVAIFVLNCTHRDDISSDALFLKKLAKAYAEINSVRLPIVVVVNKCDEMAPARQKNPSEYSQSKLEKISEVVQYYKGIILKTGLKIDQIVPVSSLIDWQTPDGNEIDADTIDNLPKSEIEALEIAYDGRYNIEKLLDILEEAILDFEAQMGLRMAARLNDVVKRMAKHLKNVFTSLAAVVALSPIPVSDIYILLILQGVMVMLIASLGGRDLSFEDAKDFILGLGGIAGLGYSFRLLAQQASKLLNKVYPGAGSAVSAAIASAGTGIIGSAAISFYIDGKTIEYVKKEAEEHRKANKE